MIFEKLSGKVNAIQFTGGNFTDIANFCNKVLEVNAIEEIPSYNIRKIIYNNLNDKNTMTIQTYAGDLTLRKNDWVVQESSGSFFIYDEFTFNKNYKSVNIKL